MDTSLIADIIADQREILDRTFEQKRLIQREILHSTRPLLRHPNALLVTGIRRCGKSTFALQLARDSKYARVNFDDERLKGLTAQELDKVLQAAYITYGRHLDTIILDEIQNVNGWEQFVSRLREHMKVIVTGSNANMMSREMATYLTGRHIDITVFPFSFREYLDFKGISKPEVAASSAKKAELISSFSSYLEEGGFPEALTFGKQFLLTLFGDIVTKDIVLRHNVRDEKAMYELARFLLSNSGREISYNRIKNAFHFGSVHTASNFVAHCEDAYLIFTLEIYQEKMLTRYTLPRKVYSSDTAIARTISGKSERGYELENAVFLELKRRGGRISYYRNDNGEVDFVLGKGEKLIQVTDASSDADLERRELKGMIDASKKIGCKELIVVTWDYEDVMQMGGRRIRLVPAWRLLASEDGLSKKLALTGQV